MNEEIFRKKSIDKIKSPESLNDYIRVTNPGVWLLLAAVIVLLIGLFVWGTFGHIETIVSGDIHVKDGEAFCYIEPADIEKVKPGAEIRWSDTEGTVTDVNVEEGYAIADIELPDGHYKAEIVLENIKPISFVLN